MGLCSTELIRRTTKGSSFVWNKKKHQSFSSTMKKSIFAVQTICLRASMLWLLQRCENAWTTLRLRRHSRWDCATFFDKTSLPRRAVPRASLKRKNKGSSILGVGQTGDDDDDSENHDGVQEDPKDDLLKKSVACKKLENELKQALHEFKSSPYSSKSKLVEHTKKLEALEKMQTQVDPTRMSKTSASKLETLAQSATKALENAKQSVKELKKLRKLDTGTVAYSEGGKSKKSKR